MTIRIVDLIPGLKVTEAHGRHDDLEDRIDYFSSGQVKGWNDYIVCYAILCHYILFYSILCYSILLHSVILSCLEGFLHVLLAIHEDLELSTAI